jgi:hypothetical protein
MNSKEKSFDEWVRNTLAPLDTPPGESDTGVLWQKIQEDLSTTKPAPKITWLSTRALWWVAAVAMLCLAVGLGWYGLLSNAPAQTAKRVQKKERTLPILTDQPLVEQPEVLASVSSRPPLPTPRVTNAISDIDRQVVTKETPESLSLKDELASDEPVPTSVQDSSSTQVLPFPPTEIRVAEKISTKPSRHKFKVVHLHEINQYQQAELAESESRKRPFIVVNFSTKTTSATEHRTLADYLKIN